MRLYLYKYRFLCKSLLLSVSIWSPHQVPYPRILFLELQYSAVTLARFVRSKIRISPEGRDAYSYIFIFAFLLLIHTNQEPLRIFFRIHSVLNCLHYGQRAWRQVLFQVFWLQQIHLMQAHRTPWLYEIYFHILPHWWLCEFAWCKSISCNWMYSSDIILCSI